jgi:hypothetical protein
VEARVLRTSIGRSGATFEVASDVLVPAVTKWRQAFASEVDTLRQAVETASVRAAQLAHRVRHLTMLALLLATLWAMTVLLLPKVAASIFKPPPCLQNGLSH